MPAPQPSVKPKVKLYLSTEAVAGVFGDGKWRLLEAVRREGTLVAAARALGRSYRKAWGDLRRAEAGLGRKLVEPSRGGSQRGKTELTPFALALLAAWDAYRRDVLRAVDRAFERRMAILAGGAAGAEDAVADRRCR
ncbi:MAG TPA: LysR family transcriptional regulator [Acidobacteriota bacterium]|nr:LysR family transcriptional regulator [Acidobacteriota bacterium]HQM62265.1 LysR family transcriptional regulator [Acidobacteriota bacterium]